MQPLLYRLVGDAIDLAYVQAAGLWPVQLPAGKLEETFLALAVDACQAMADGGVLRLETANATAVAGLPAGRWVMLAVSDTRRPVSEAVRAAVRGHGRREGLGVRLAFEVAETAGGHVLVEPNPGGGTTVRIYLPAAGTEPPREAGPADLPTGTETILIVEDEKSLMSVAGRVLARLGYSVIGAGSGETALRHLENVDLPVHLLLTDLMLPGMDGLALAREARAKRADLKVLFMSGFSEEALRLREAGGADAQLLEKPFTVEALARAVRAALR
jgi:CheY-like chemotaxis protein